MNMTTTDFEELKRYFDQNDLYNGAECLNRLFQQWIASSHEGAGYGYTPQPLSSQPQGLTTHSCHNGMDYTTAIGIDPQILTDIDTLKMQMVDVQCGTDHDSVTMKCKVHELEQQVATLMQMHNGSGEDHVPVILSSRAQWDEMKDEIDSEEEVIVKTSFERAMRVLD